jgi:hypothetical protein
MGRSINALHRHVREETQNRIAGSRIKPQIRTEWFNRRFLSFRKIDLKCKNGVSLAYDSRPLGHVVCLRSCHTFQ